MVKSGLKVEQQRCYIGAGTDTERFDTERFEEINKKRESEEADKSKEIK